MGFAAQCAGFFVSHATQWNIGLRMATDSGAAVAAKIALRPIAVILAIDNRIVCIFYVNRTAIVAMLRDWQCVFDFIHNKTILQKERRRLKRRSITSN